MTPSEYDRPISPTRDVTLGYLYFLDSRHPLANSGGKVYHHRHIASVKLGRWLLPSEVVHHIDEHKDNNAPENLEILTASEHMRLHSLQHGRSVPREVVCPICGVTFMTCNNTYCSVPCSTRSRAKLSSVTREQLADLVWRMPTVQVAEMFNVSDSAIGKKCKQFGVPKPPRGYWEKIYHGVDQ